MDYSNKGILIMLQDLQRTVFGKVSMFVDIIILDDSTMVACCVFDKDGEPHTSNFYAYESDDKHMKEYLKVLKLVNENATA